MRHHVALITLAALALAACGGGSDNAADTIAEPVTTAAPAVTDSPTTTAAPATTAAPLATEPPATVALADTTVANPAAPSGPVGISLVEWEITADTAIRAGTVTFDITNSGDFPHHFAVARGDSYEELPQIGGGAIDEDALGDDFLGRTDNLQSGQTTTIDFDLEPGNYVFFCNIASTVSHAAQGQTLAVTVT